MIIKGEWRIPWLIKDSIEEIRSHINNIHAKITHIYREANQLVDSQANYALNQGEEI